MTGRPLSLQQARAARMCADAIVAGRRANLLRDDPEWVEAVAAHLALITGVALEDAKAHLVREHYAVLKLAPGTKARPHWWPKDREDSRRTR